MKQECATCRYNDEDLPTNKVNTFCIDCDDFNEWEPRMDLLPTRFSNWEPSTRGDN